MRQRRFILGSVILGDRGVISVKNWVFQSEDKEVAESLQSFIPEKIFDVHAHIYRVSDLYLQNHSVLSEHAEEVSIDLWRKQQEKQLGVGKMTGGLFFSFPVLTADNDRQNDYLIQQLDQYPDSRGLVLARPEDSKEKIKDYFNHQQIIGLKVYHFFSPEKPTWQSSIKGFVPEWMWQLAHEKEGIIMLHMVKDRAVSDPNNQKEIRKMCEKYPKVKLILAHCARSFHSKDAKGVSALRGLGNIWFDMSGICESEAIEHLLYEFGPRKIIWGSDFPISETRGRSVTLGNGFAWLQSESLRENVACAHSQPLLVGLESVRALQHAAESFGLQDKDIEDIFYYNALRVTGISDPELGKTQELYNYAKRHIPGATQLLSKRPEMMAPGKWPAYFREARGCEVWDMDGKHYYDMATNGIGSCLLGFRDHDVTQAVKRRLLLGSMSTLNPPEEIELADRLLDLHPWADQARFMRAGGEACAAAVRVARATTDRSVVAICGYHGWQDWYVAANLGESDALRGHHLPGLKPLGVPRELRGTTLTFSYNDKQGLRDIIDQYGDQLAAVVMEPCRHNNPEPRFLEYVRDQTKKNGAMLIFDEITIGWRLNYGGAHLKYNVNPDMAVFAKALGNGHPIAAVIGTTAAMEGAHESFISSTYWTESIGPVAAVATLKKMEQYHVQDYIDQMGKMVEAAWHRSGNKHGLPIVTGEGFSCFASFRFEHPYAAELKTLYTQRMLEKGFLAGTSFYVTLAHNIHVIDLYAAAIDEVFAELSTLLNGEKDLPINAEEVAHSGFARLI